MADQELKKILSRYKRKIEQHVDEDDAAPTEFSKEYEEFRREALSKAESSYEKWCAVAEGLIRFKPNSKEIPEVEKAIETAHLNITPVGAASLAALVAFLFI